ncbi:GRIP domain [Popillia japonica]|uniref:GRIP domain n=1 Tax=Popillia japonica TaxID=7064 RepID=A0AAW1K050_POPJA
MDNSDTHAKKVPLEDLSKDELVARCKYFLAIAQKAKQSKDAALEDLSKDELVARCKYFLAIAQKAKQSKDAAREENNRLKEQLSKQQTFSSEEQKVDLLTNLEELKSEKVRLDNKFSQCITKLQDAESKISDLDTANQSYKRRVDRLTEENEQLIIHLDGLEKQIEELKTVGLQQQEQLLELEKSNLQLTRTNDNISQKLEENGNDLQTMELQNMLSVSLEELKYMKSENSKLNDSLKHLEAIVRDKDEKLSLKDNDLVEKVKIIERLELDINELKNAPTSEENNDLEMKIVHLRKELELSESIISNLKADVNSKNIEMEKNINLIDDLKTEVHKNKALVEKLNNDITNMNHKLTDNQIMSSGVSEWKEQLSLLLDKIEDYDRENKEILLQNQSYKRDIEAKTIEYENILMKLKESEELKGVNKSLKDELNVLQQKIQNLEEDNDDKVNKTIQELQDAISSLNEQLTREKQEFIEATAKIREENESEKAELSRQYEEFFANWEKATKEGIELKLTIKELEDKLEEIQQVRTNLEGEIVRLKEENNDLVAKREELHNLESENKNLTEKLEESTKIIEPLRKEVELSKKQLTDLENINITLREQLKEVNRQEVELADKSKEEILSLVRKNNDLEANIQKLKNTASFNKEVQTGTDLCNLEEIISSLKRENAELLSEMNEMNQALKERGGTISKQEAHFDEIIRKLQNYESQLKDNSNKKEEEIAHLKSEIQELRDRLLSVSQSDAQSDIHYAESENMSTSTISKTEDMNRMRDLDSSWEERYGKLRNFALKLKGKIRDLTADLQKEQGEKADLHQKHAKTIQTFQQQIDKLQDELEVSKSDCKQYLKKLDTVALEISKNKKELAQNEEAISQLKSEIDGLNKEKTNTDNWKKQVSAKIQALKKELEANNLLKKEFENKINKLNAELESKDKALKHEIDRHNQTKSVLQESNNECKKQSVLNLEMQDYERSVKELSQKIEKKQEIINKLKTQLDTQKTSFNTLKEENQELDENIKLWEDKFDKINGENEFNKKKLNELENNLSEKDNKLQDLTYAIEKIRSDNEDLSTQLSKSIAEHQKLTNSLREECDILKSKNMGLEQSLREVKDSLRMKEQEFSEMEKEYGGYKVRAQSVLRQNQNRDLGAEEKLTEEAASLRAQVDILTTQLNELRSTLDKTNTNSDKLQSERDELSARIKSLDLLIENQKESYEQLSAKHQQTLSEHAETIRGIKIHSDTLSQCYQQQIREQESRHNREIIELQSKLDRGSTPLENSPIIPTMPREEGEGSESVDSAPNNSIQPLPLDKLLSNETEHEVSNMRKQLTEHESKLSHLTALLADTEQDLAKYVQLNKVLKEEIRRQQRSTEREKHAQNLEYMKNVVFKFITLGNGDERSRLVPVLNTILKLSPEECQKLYNVAKVLSKREITCKYGQRKDSY